MNAGGSDVSVIVTAYNYAHFLDGALQSVMAQTTPALEVIVVDDGSKDHPETVTERYPGVSLIRQANQGASAARNTGWRAARGRYVVFLDADDRMLPDNLACNLARFAAQPDCGLVYGVHCDVDAASGRVTAAPFRDVGDDPFGFLLRTNPISMPGIVMYRRDRLEAVGGFDITKPPCEDYDLYLRMAHRFPVACGPEVLAEYWYHGGNISANFPRMLNGAIRVLDGVREAANARPEWRKAYRRGLRWWSGFYVRQWLRALRTAVLGGKLSWKLLWQGAQLAAIVLRTAPRWALRPL
jgi:glycosyltransferase involved in cell wall biosynthesis